MSEGVATDLGPEDIVAVPSPIARSRAEAAWRAGVSPTVMQSTSLIGEAGKCNLRMSRHVRDQILDEH